MTVEKLTTLLRTTARVLAEVVPLVAEAVIQALQRLKRKS